MPQPQMDAKSDKSCNLFRIRANSRNSCKSPLFPSVLIRVHLWQKPPLQKSPGARWRNLPSVPDYQYATYPFLLSQNCSKKVQKIVDTVLALWDSRNTHGNK